MNSNQPILLVPLDGSECSEAALPVAARLAKQLDAHVVLLRTIEPMTESIPSGEDLIPLIDLEERRVREQLHDATRAFGPRHVEIAVLVDRNPASAIITWLEANPVDYVVMATHGRGGLSRLIAGSVTEAVLRSGLVPV